MILKSPLVWLLLAVVAALAFYVTRPPDPTGLTDSGPPSLSAAVKRELTQDLTAGYDDFGNLLQPGPRQGAAPSTSYGRPVSWFADQGTKFEWQPSPNWSGRGSNPIDAIVVHVTAGGTCDGIVNFFKNPDSRVSAHFLVCPEKVVQQVEIGDTAWHAGVYGGSLNPLNNPLITSWWRAGINPNDRTVGVETLLATGQQLDNFPSMKENLIDLLVYLTTTLNLPPDRIHIIGHFEINTTDRPSDPKCCMDLDKIVAEVAKRVFAPPPAAPIPTKPIDLSWQRWVGAAAFFDEYSFSGRQAVNAAFDFKLPDDVGLVDIEFFLRSGSATVWDGGTYPFGRACYIETGVTQCTVALSKDGWFEIEGQGVIDQLVITGAYRGSR